MLFNVSYQLTRMFFQVSIYLRFQSCTWITRLKDLSILNAMNTKISIYCDVKPVIS